MAKDIGSRLKDAFEKNKPAFILVALLLLGGLAALTRLPGARGPIERRVKSTGGAPFAGKVEKWNAPTMRRSDPGALIKLGDALVETSEGAAQAQGAPVVDEAAGRAKAGRGSESAGPDEAFPPELRDGRGSGSGSARLQRVGGFDNKSQGGGGASSAQAEADAAEAPGRGGALPAAGGSGPLSTLKRNLAILGRRAARLMGAGAGSGTGGAKSFSGGRGDLFEARPGGGLDISGGDAIQRTGAQASGLGLTRAPAGASNGGTGGGSGGTGGGGGASGGSGGSDGGGSGSTGGATSGSTSGTTPGPQKECEQNCKDKCAKAGKAGDGLCLKECIRHERCDGGGSPEPPSCPAPPDFFEPVPNRVDIVRLTAAAHPDWIKAACQPGHPDKDKFIDALVDALRADNTNRWGYVCKRGNCSNISEDCVGYYAGPNPRNGGGDVIAIDVIRNCGEEDHPQWINWDCFHRGTKWTCKRDGTCSSAPPPTTPPPTTPPPGGDPPPGGGPGGDGGPENREI